MNASLCSAVAACGLVLALASPAAAQTMDLPEPVGMDGNPAGKAVLDGNAAFLHGKLDAAAADYRAALKRAPDLAVATFNLGLVEFHQGRTADGVHEMDRGIRLASEHGMSAAYVERLKRLRQAFSSAPLST